MSDGKLVVNYEAALDEAEKIKKLVGDMEAVFQRLDAQYSRTDEVIELGWFDKQRNEWNTYFKSSIPSVLEEMRTTKANIEEIVNKMKTYSQQ